MNGVEPRVGVGLVYQPQLRSFVAAFPDTFDYIELVPDTLWRDLGPGHAPRYIEITESLDWIAALSRPVVLHSIGLSIASVHRFDVDHVLQVARCQQRFAARWHSDHLAWHLAERDGEELNVNLTLPVTLDRQMLEMLVDRVIRVRSLVDAPFLLENNVYYFDCGPADFGEAEFLNELCRRADCHLLLDLHNVYVNARNRGTDASRFLDELDLDRVVEVHVAGGFEFAGFYLDAHSGVVPEPVWDLLDEAVPRCVNLRGVTFELFGSWYDTLGPDQLCRELGRVSTCLSHATTLRDGGR